MHSDHPEAHHHKNKHLAERFEGLIGALMVVAIVLLAMSFATQGVIPPHAAFAIVLGANLGSAINPVLEGTADDNPAARRLPWGNFINRLISQF